MGNHLSRDYHNYTTFPHLVPRYQRPHPTQRSRTSASTTKPFEGSHTTTGGINDHHGNAPFIPAACACVREQFTYIIQTSNNLIGIRNEARSLTRKRHIK